ncbi:MAG: hypothetical protein AB7K09_25695, partial [Planctomycetota bacterium]
ARALIPLNAPLDFAPSMFGSNSAANLVATVAALVAAVVALIAVARPSVDTPFFLPIMSAMLLITPPIIICIESLPAIRLALLAIAIPALILAALTAAITW